MKTQFKMRLLNQALAAAVATLAGASAHAAEYNLKVVVFDKTLNQGPTVPMWGYALCTDSSFTSCEAPSVPGPALTVPAGDTLLQVNLRNELPTAPGAGAVPYRFPTATSVVIPGLGIPANPAGSNAPVRRTDDPRRVQSFVHETPSGATGSYVFSNVQPGTYLYHSGTHPALQVQMGLYGAVAAKAAGDPAGDVTVLVSEVDPVFHHVVAAGTYDPGVDNVAAAANGMTTTPQYYVPTWFLVNGEPYFPGDADTPASGPVNAAGLAAGTPARLRLLNAGQRSHNLILNGMDMRLLREDGKAYAWPRTQYSAFLPPLKTVDAQITPPAGAADADYALYDRRLALSSNGSGFGGMFGKIRVGSGVAAVISITEVACPPASTTTDQGVAMGSCVIRANGPAAPKFTLVQGPAGMTVATGITAINADGTVDVTGTVSWTPTNATVGANQPVKLSITAPGAPAVEHSFAVTANNRNDAPVAGADAFSLTQGGSLTVTPAQVLANDSDPDQQVAGSGEVLGAAFGTLPAGAVQNADGSFTFTASAAGTFTVPYTVSDGGLWASAPGVAPAAAAGTPLTAAGTVTLTVKANQAPVAAADSFTVPRNSSGNVLTVLANDYDPDQYVDPTNVIDPASVVLMPGNLKNGASAKGGTVTVQADGSVLYAPKANFFGTDSFKYRVADRLGKYSTVATAKVVVRR